MFRKTRTDPELRTIGFISKILVFAVAVSAARSVFDGCFDTVSLHFFVKGGGLDREQFCGGGFVSAGLEESIFDHRFFDLSELFAEVDPFAWSSPRKLRLQHFFKCVDLSDHQQDH